MLLVGKYRSSSKMVTVTYFSRSQATTLFDFGSDHLKANASSHNMVTMHAFGRKIQVRFENCDLDLLFKVTGGHFV